MIVAEVDEDEGLIDEDTFVYIIEHCNRASPSFALWDTVCDTVGNLFFLNFEIL